jgi:hypothetical protein
VDKATVSMRMGEGKPLVRAAARRCRITTARQVMSYMLGESESSMSFVLAPHVTQ